MSNGPDISKAGAYLTAAGCAMICLSPFIIVLIFVVVTLLGKLFGY